MIFLLCDPDRQFLAKNHFSEKKYAYMLITHQIKQEEVKSRILFLQSYTNKIAQKCIDND